MSGIKKLLREYNLISAALVATVGFALAMEWIVLTEVQIGALLGLLAAWLLVMRFIVTPTADPILPDGTTGRLPDGSPATFHKDI